MKLHLSELLLHNNVISILKIKRNIASYSCKIFALSDEVTSHKPNPKKWSRKEILGHLIDSASNNHQRFVRLQIDNEIELPKYKQDEWVAVQRWQQKNWEEIIALWKLYNQHILHIFQHIDESKLFNTVTLGDEEDEIYTLQFLIDDYVDHMEHHLKQIFAE